jgi:hypothetical protein
MQNSSYFQIIFGVIALGSVVRMAFVKNIYDASVFMLTLHMSVAGLILELGYAYVALVLFFAAIIFNVGLLSYGFIIKGNLKNSVEINSNAPAQAVLRFAMFMFIILLASSLAFVLTPFVGSMNVSNIAGVVSFGDIYFGKHVVSLQLIAILCLSVLLGSGVMFSRAEGKHHE